MDLIIPNWKVPDNIQAYSTTRDGGVSEGVYEGLNLGTHVADDPMLVAENRKRLHEAAGLPAPQIWLNQTHSNHVAEVEAPTSEVIDADGVTATEKKLVCTVMTADCLPVLMTDTEGSRVAAVHAGWRGLADGILENAARKFDKPLIAWLGPAIGADAFEVGQDVYDVFVSYSINAKAAFSEKGNGKYLADMNALAEQRLNDAGVSSIYKSNMCTFNDPQRFYSYRRDGVTGRQASFIWIK